MSQPNLTFLRAEAHSFDHSVTDKKKPTAYRVLVGGQQIGIVRSRSEESWTTNGRIRIHFRGHARHWTAVFPDGTDSRFNYSRQQAVQRLLDRAAQRPACHEHATFSNGNDKLAEGGKTP